MVNLFLHAKYLVDNVFELFKFRDWVGRLCELSSHVLGGANPEFVQQICYNFWSVGGMVFKPMAQMSTRAMGFKKSTRI
jgi:hypothetical protein